MADEASRLIALAEIARPHGVRGELRLKLYNRDSDLLLELDHIVLEPSGGGRTTVAVREARRANDAMLVWLEGCDSRDRAEELRGAKILASREVFPPLEDGEFYVCDVIGAQAVTAEGLIGVVEGLLSYPTCDALVIRRTRGDTLELPLVDGVVDEVDVVAGVVRLLQGDPLASTDKDAESAAAAKLSRTTRHQEKVARRRSRSAAAADAASGVSPEPASPAGQAGPPSAEAKPDEGGAAG